MSWLFDKHLKTEASKLFNRFWWILVVVAAVEKKPPPLIYSFNCEKIRIYNKEKFQTIINRNSNEIIKTLNISFDDNDPGIKFQDVSLITVGMMAIYKLNKKCINPNKLLNPIKNKNELMKKHITEQNLSKNAKILFYILGVETYEHIKDLNFGSLGFYSEKVKEWENGLLQKQLKEYREFLGLEENDVHEIQNAYDLIVEKGHFP